MLKTCFDHRALQQLYRFDGEWCVPNTGAGTAAHPCMLGTTDCCTTSSTKVDFRFPPHTNRGAYVHASRRNLKNCRISKEEELDICFDEVAGKSGVVQNL